MIFSPLSPRTCTLIFFISSTLSLKTRCILIFVFFFFYFLFKKKNLKRLLLGYLEKREKEEERKKERKKDELSRRRRREKKREENPGGSSNTCGAGPCGRKPEERILYGTSLLTFVPKEGEMKERLPPPDLWRYTLGRAKSWERTRSRSDGEKPRRFLGSLSEAASHQDEELNFVEGYMKPAAAAEHGELVLKVPAELLNVLVEEPECKLTFVAAPAQWHLPSRGSCIHGLPRHGRRRTWRRWWMWASMLFPCRDALHERSRFEIMLTTSAHHVALGSGVAIDDSCENIVTDDGKYGEKKTKNWHFSTGSCRLAACSIGFVVGNFVTVKDAHDDSLQYHILRQKTKALTAAATSAVAHTTSQMHKVRPFLKRYLGAAAHDAWASTFGTHRFLGRPSVRIALAVRFTVATPKEALLREKSDRESAVEAILAAAHGIAWNYLGCVLGSDSWQDCWLPVGLTLCGRSLRKILSASIRVRHAHSALPRLHLQG